MPSGVYKRTEAHKKNLSIAQNRPGAVDKHRKSAKESWKDPKVRTSRIEGIKRAIKEVWSKPGMIARMSGENSSNWKNVDELGYGGLHDRARKVHGKPKKCEKCGTTKAKRFDWHNISGENNTDRGNWLRLCRPCHMKIDNIASVKSGDSTGS